MNRSKEGAGQGARAALRVGPYLDGQPTVEERGAIYRELLGFVPERIAARFRVTGALDAEMLTLQEDARRRGMYPKCFDIKTSQLMLFAILLMALNEAAPVHARAAVRAGARLDELQAVVNMVFLYRGLPAANWGAQILESLCAE